MELIVNKAKNDVIKLILKTRKISRQVELMIVVGQKDNPITNELYDMAIKGCNNAMIVETMEDLYINYIKRFKKVGLTVETTFPQDIAEDIIKILKNTKTENYMYEICR